MSSKKRKETSKCIPSKDFSFTIQAKSVVHGEESQLYSWLCVCDGLMLWGVINAGYILILTGCAADMSGVCGGDREYLEVPSYPRDTC